MPDRILEEAIRDRERRWARVTLAVAYLSIIALVAFVGVLAHDADQRADRASRSACNLVSIVDRETRLLDSGLAVLIAKPGEQKQPLDELRAEVDQQKRAAASSSNAQGCK